MTYRSTMCLFNPYHDRLGRFAAKREDAISGAIAAVGDLVKGDIFGKVLFHGTRSAKDIRRGGFVASRGTSGFTGVFLTTKRGEASRYAGVGATWIARKGKEILRVLILAKKPYIFQTGDVFDEFGEDAVKDMIQRFGRPSFTTRFLQEQGYDSAVVPSTIGTLGALELVVFDPKDVMMVGRSGAR